MITEAECNLLVRAARIVHTNAAGSLALAGEDWSANPASRQAKRDYDRFLREERDIRALVARLKKAGLIRKAEPVAPAVES